MDVDDVYLAFGERAVHRLLAALGSAVWRHGCRMVLVRHNTVTGWYEAVDAVGEVLATARSYELATLVSKALAEDWPAEIGEALAEVAKVDEREWQVRLAATRQLGSAIDAVLQVWPLLYEAIRSRDAAVRRRRIRMARRRRRYGGYPPPANEPPLSSETIARLVGELYAAIVELGSARASADERGMLDE